MATKTEENYDVLLTAAEGGDVKSMILLGDTLMRSPESTDRIAGFGWYEKAALVGGPEAEFKYAECLYLGYGCESNYELALYYFTPLASGQSSRAAFYVGQSYSLGRGVTVDHNLAYKYYLTAANAGLLRAMFFVARRLRSGLGVNKDTKESNKWLNKLAKKNYVDALYYIGECYDRALGYRKNYFKAFEYYSKAAALGHPDSMFEVGYAYYGGWGVSKDIEKAQHYFKLAYGKGQTRALYYITNPAIHDAKRKLVEIGVSEAKAKEVQSALLDVEEKFLSIRKRHTLTEKTEVAHFTRWEALESILPLNTLDGGRNHLRRYNVDYLNDPMEGRRLINRHAGDNVAENVKWVSEKLDKIYSEKYYSSFALDKSVGDLLPSVYSVSFTEAIDRLELWRAYGADGDGFCISIPVPEKEDTISLMRHKTSQVDFHGNENSLECEQESNGIPWLYRIFYDDAKVDRTLLDLHGPLHKLDSIAKGLPDVAFDLIDSAVAAILIELLHLYKDEQYSAEKEVRSLITLRMSDARVELDVRNGSLGRVYCKTGNFLFRDGGAKIIVGPKVKNQSDAIWNLRYRLHRNGFSDNTSVIVSKVKYR